MGPELANHAVGNGLLGHAGPRKRSTPQGRRRGALLVAAAAGRGEPEPYALLQVPRGASRRAIRAAYIERIKLLHPDVSASGDDTTAAAAALNAAYDRLMEGARNGGPAEGGSRAVWPGMLPAGWSCGALGEQCVAFVATTTQGYRGCGRREGGAQEEACTPVQRQRTSQLVTVC